MISELSNNHKINNYTKIKNKLLRHIVLSCLCWRHSLLWYVVILSGSKTVRFLSLVYIFSAVGDPIINSRGIGILLTSVTSPHFCAFSSQDLVKYIVRYLHSYNNVCKYPTIVANITLRNCLKDEPSQGKVVDHQRNLSLQLSVFVLSFPS